jgi:MFS family permease
VAVETPPESLKQALGRFELGEVLRWDLLAGVIGGCGAGLLAHFSPSTMDGLAGLVVGVVGVFVGAVVAGAAILGSFLDQAFLKKLKMIGREPVRYLAPFLFTATLGVIAAFAALILGALPPATPGFIFVTVSVLVGTFSWWTIASVLYDLDMLVQFIGLQVDAVDVQIDGDLPSVPRRAVDERRREER